MIWDILINPVDWAETLKNRKDLRVLLKGVVEKVKQYCNAYREDPSNGIAKRIDDAFSDQNDSSDFKMAISQLVKNGCRIAPGEPVLSQNKISVQELKSLGNLYDRICLRDEEHLTPAVENYYEGTKITKKCRATPWWWLFESDAFRELEDLWTEPIAIGELTKNIWKRHFHRLAESCRTLTIVDQYLVGGDEADPKVRKSYRKRHIKGMEQLFSCLAGSVGTEMPGEQGKPHLEIQVYTTCVPTPFHRRHDAAAGLTKEQWDQKWVEIAKEKRDEIEKVIRSCQWKMDVDLEIKICTENKSRQKLFHLQRYLFDRKRQVSMDRRTDGTFAIEESKDVNQISTQYIGSKEKIIYRDIDEAAGKSKITKRTVIRVR